jgi:hypothetical protein
MLEYGDEKTAQAVADAISPDNFKVPVGLAIKTMRKENKVVTEMNSKEKIAMFIATIDDLLSSVSVAERTLNAIQRG